MTDTSLKDTVAIVTGGASGLGRAITIGLANAGAHVIATASQSRDELEALAGAEVGKGRVVPSIADVTSDSDCKRVVAEAISKFGKLDVLVNNAGRGMKYVDETFLTKPTRFWETAPDTWRMIIDTNVNGPFLMARAAVQHLLAAGWGRIVNISMSYETMKRQGVSPYGPSKAALESETIIWAQDVIDTSTRVTPNNVCGAVENGMIPDTFPKDMRTKLMRPDIMVPPLLWLASASSDGFTGHRIIAAEWKGEPGQPRDAGWH
jgi:3-oxoacyl-[acyl-carrier protein] reductase